MSSTAEKLLLHRIVLLNGETSKKECDRISEQLISLQLESASEPIHLIIDSPGGSMDAALEVHDLIRHILTVPVHALIVGLCASAATFILLACDIRRAIPHAGILIHSGTRKNIALKMSEMTKGQVEELLKEITRSTEEIIRFYMEKLSKSRDEIQTLIARGDADFNQEIWAQEALKLGIITEIVSGKAGIFKVVNN